MRGEHLSNPAPQFGSSAPEISSGARAGAEPSVGAKMASLLATPEGQRNALLVALGLLAAGALTFWMIYARAPRNQPSTPLAETAVVIVQEYAARSVVVRNIPTTIGSQEITRLARGEALQGNWVTGSDGVHQWLKLTVGPYQGDYISAVNLSPIPRPSLIRIVNQDMRLAQPGQIFATTTPGEAAIDTLAAGTLVHVAGEVDGGWMEIERRLGGVGYIPSTDFDAPSSGPQNQAVPR